MAKMNRHQRRRWQTLLRRAEPESVPKHVVDDIPCDMPGCSNVWMFATHAKENGERKVVARRCTEHRLS